MRPPFLCQKLMFIISLFSYKTISLLLFTNFVAVYNHAYDAIVASITRIVFFYGVSLNLYLHSVIGLVLFELVSNKSHDHNVIVPSSAFGTSSTVEGESSPSIGSPLVDDIQKTEREYLLAKLQVFYYYEPPFYFILCHTLNTSYTLYSNA